MADVTDTELPLLLSKNEMKSAKVKIDFDNDIKSYFGENIDILFTELLNLLDVIEKNCEICIKYKKPSLKPAVGFSLSKEFNDVISMDLKHINGITFLHITDHATRFSTAQYLNQRVKKK